MNKKHLASLICLLFLFLSGHSLSEEIEIFTISEMQLKYITNSTGKKIHISCRVTHQQGSIFITRVAASIYHGNLISTYPTLFDDGTHGDNIENDGIYSLDISKTQVQANQKIKIVFIAIDKAGEEIESEPLIVDPSSHP